ncbi:MAG: indolepyruvate ferredoxin oxidoreductase subunit alpha [Candidatus Thorarchaeota archaeon]|nr:indolepyruvate ferredoxin oxidoreductase subunit alpha [Candidatus Thorarchaeota archaeon]
MVQDDGRRILMSGNEAIARGAVEAGVGVCVSYPGTPSTEITTTLMKWSRETGMYVEWGVNEKVALETAAAASWVGIPAICPMKSLGLNVAADFLLNLNLSGTGKGGLVIVVCDDPRGHSSSNEQDSRFYAKAAKIPLIEPATAQQAKDLIPYAISLSQREQIPVMIRSTTRLSHTQAIVTLGNIPERTIALEERIPEGLFNVPWPHHRDRDLQETLKRVGKEFDQSSWNRVLLDSDDPRLTVLSSGVGQLYANEAIQRIGSDRRIRHVGVVTTHPLPETLIKKTIAETEEMMLFVEEVDPFLEDGITSMATEIPPLTMTFHGKHDGLVPSWGELSIDIVLHALQDVLQLPRPKKTPREDILTKALKILIPRPLTFCAGCTHRNVYWALRKVKQRLNGRLVVTGDIGCYSLGVFYNRTMDTMQAMGSGIGTANGLGQLHRFGYSARVATIAGDSTFFHACLPGLVNARHTDADVMFIIVDNKTTAMTGFQPHPGVEGGNAHQKAVSIRRVVEAIKPDAIASVDGENIPELIDTFHSMITKIGLKVVIVKSSCRLEEQRRDPAIYQQKPRIVIRKDRCKGNQCGICVRQYSCVALGWDSEQRVPVVLEDQCVRCGACIDVCPYEAIQREE